MAARKATSVSGPQPEATTDWRAELLEQVRQIILQADPEIGEECKWKKPSNPAGVPVWSRAGILCTGETYKQYVKLTFARGAFLDDPKQLFNASLEGNLRRAIDLHEGEQLNVKAFKALIRAAVVENLSRSTAKSTALKKPEAKTKAKSAEAGGETNVVLLSGGNPQIPKGEGDAPVQAYIAAMPVWKSGLGQRLDELITSTVPGVRKAVKWNSPFYGIEGQGWFVSFHVFTRYVKVTFFSGASLRPEPPGKTPKSGEARWLDLYEADGLNQRQMAAWIRQAADLPGWIP